MFRITWLALVVGALILIILVSLSEWRGVPRHVTDEECRVYEALYAHSDSQNRFYFAPLTQSFNRIGRNGDETTAPSNFIRETGEYEEIELGRDGTTFKRPIVENFELSTNSFFDPVWNSNATSLANCFDDLERPPRFFSGHFQDLLDNDPDADPVGDGMVTYMVLTRVSRVGFSADQRFALFYSEHHCGALCGAGVFILLERGGDRWKIVGSSTMWIS